MKTRNQIDDKYKWDLTLIYKSEKLFLEELNTLSKEINSISKYKGIILSSGDNLYDYLKCSEKLERKIKKLYMYAFLKSDENLTDTHNQENIGKIINLSVEYDNLNSYSKVEMMHSSYEELLVLIKGDERFEDYKHYFKDLYRYKKHILDEKSESMLSKLEKIFSGAEDVRDSFVYADLKFGYITDEKGEVVELTESNYVSFLESKDKRIRKKVFYKLFSKYASYKNMLAKTFSNNVEKCTILASLKNYNSSLEASLFDDGIDPVIYNNIIEVVNENLDVIYKYYNLLKSESKIKKFNIYDIYISIANDYEKKYSFEDAKKLVLESLEILGDEYISIVKKSFDERWIDVYPNKGKRGGAYSTGSYDTPAYELLNFENRFKDVSTLAHETGHTVNTYLSNKKQSYINSEYPIFTAEVASTVNELLLNYYILNNSNDIKEKKYILNKMMELYKGTIFRQVMFAEFEKNCHEKCENGDILTNEVLCDDYLSLVKKYFGPNVIINDLIKYEWCRIPHFYSEFYVYKYALGLAVASYIVDGIINKKVGAVENYLEFLSAGGSDYPVNILKKAGVDVCNKTFMKKAISMFENIMDEYLNLKEN